MTSTALALPPLQVPPALDPDFVPAALWNRAYHALAASHPDAETLHLALERRPGDISRLELLLLPEGTEDALTTRYVERHLKFLLWQQGGARVLLSGRPALAARLRAVYAPGGTRAFDADFLGGQIYRRAFTLETVAPDDLPEPTLLQHRLGRHLDGFRIGFDLGGSDRKCAAVAEGRVVFSEEIRWDPYFQKDPAYHLDGIRDSLRRAAAHLPRVDAIGGSAAGVYVGNEICAASLFRGVPREVFDDAVRPLFHRLRREWGDIPFEVMNDGEVTALAGSMALQDNAVLGISLGTSQAGGYVTPAGGLTTWLNELAFAPVDHNPAAPVDEWSGDGGCGVQYFSQQAVARLAVRAGIALPDALPLADRLLTVQELADKGDSRALAVFQTIGSYLGYSIARYADAFDFRHLLLLGRVMTGRGGAEILEIAGRVLQAEFPALHGSIHLTTPDEQQKRHGQAIAAASLPEIPKP